ncbi:MAG: bifunctional hydroxymethylpyrimidine kinase/phosphomethylpyrimidine kinase [Bryobacterales bacterium]|nr:bifunctional hydroxymethylpyrimidine kinase/phosphomethylpyrimidine kinase [Bryobacterales bacterium]
MKPVALTIAGSDPSGGAGIQADLKTFHQFGVYGEAAITLLTVQNTQRVDLVECLSPALVVRQVTAAIEDIPPAAAKTGALGDAALVEAIAGIAAVFAFPLVVDPVLISKHGSPLMAEEAQQLFVRHMLPVSFLITPNLFEAEVLTGRPVRTEGEMVDAAHRLRDMGAKAALVKGGHLAGEPVDILIDQEGAEHRFTAPRIETKHTHGTGCTYSAAITACLALGLPLVDAVARAKHYITEAVRTNPGLGGGNGPVNHHASTSQQE